MREAAGGSIRSIIVGAGGVTRSMLRSLTQKPWHEIAAVVDTNPAALQRAADEYGLPESALFNDLDVAIQQIPADVALINTPSELHHSQTKTALLGGLSPLVAKPLTNNYADSCALVDLAAENGLRLCVGQQMRYFRHYQVVGEFVASGEMGSIEQIFFFNAKPRHQAKNLAGFDQPALWEMTCHHLDCLFGILPMLVPDSIVCDGFMPSWSVYDSACMINALLRCQGGARLLYHAGFSSQSDCYELRLEGSRGALRCRGLHMSKDQMTYEFARRGESFSEIDLNQGRAPTQPWSLFFDRWRDYLRGGTEPHFSGRKNLRVLAVIQAAIESLVSGAFVDIADPLRQESAV
ncbi:MAG: Gfo/Idh/MocA family oxidoreductase [Chloroflexi bacterium]|nr:Gfo/Idh/MocA family oxidoreductase [Chloroflexota bacterium]MCY4246036.1 Gfo/Idh/MocA family oxidoreductase [Chloroflexota bacterium]